MPSESRLRQAAQTRAKILDAAKQIFEELGFLPARVADIVRRAGVAHGSFYHYFDSKEDIFRELAAVADARLNAPMQEVILAHGSEAPPAQRIRKSVRRFLEAYRREARIMGVVEEVSRHDEYLRESRNKRLRQYNDELADSIQQLQRRGLADPTLDPTLASAILGSITVRFPEMWLVHEVVDCSLDDAVEQIAKIFINALGLKEESG